MTLMYKNGYYIIDDTHLFNFNKSVQAHGIYVDTTVFEPTETETSFISQIDNTEYTINKYVHKTSEETLIITESILGGIYNLFYINDFDHIYSNGKYILEFLQNTEDEENIFTYYRIKLGIELFGILKIKNNKTIEIIKQEDMEEI